MPIRPDVGRLESIASNLRSWSDDIGKINTELYNKTASMLWTGHAFNKFDAKYKEIQANLTRTSTLMRGYAATLDSLASAFRSADLEAERIERERLAAAAAARQNQKSIRS
jgi:Uncharacterized protein conserved in bacteria